MPRNNGHKTLTRGERLQIMLSPEELAAVDDFRFRQRMPSRAAAVRELGEETGLRAEAQALEPVGRVVEAEALLDLYVVRGLGDLTLRLIAQLSYVGSARLTFNPAFSARTDPVVNTQLIAQLARAPWTATIFVSNPADRSGNTFAYGNPFTFGLVRQITPQRPRTVGVRLAAAF